MIDTFRIKQQLIGGPLDGSEVNVADYKILAIPMVTQLKNGSMHFTYCLYEKKDGALHYIETMKGK
ncbi:MAG: hypothetical protein DRQ46_00155 [Gammaproteobacteria bacterium]|nr:MAG: hypothetical protein DRQ46_00155 [Gammaproteobacteria bacterium]